MSLRESAASGDRAAALRDLRDLLAAQIESCDSLRDLAALTNRFQSVLAELADLTKDAEKAGDSIDEIAARRAARGGATARPGQATRGAG